MVSPTQLCWRYHCLPLRGRHGTTNSHYSVQLFVQADNKENTKAPHYSPQIARFMWPTWDSPGADRTQVGPMLAPWTLLSGSLWGWPVTCDWWIAVITQFQSQISHTVEGYWDQCNTNYWIKIMIWNLHILLSFTARFSNKIPCHLLTSYE